MFILFNLICKKPSRTLLNRVGFFFFAARVCVCVCVCDALKEIMDNDRKTSYFLLACFCCVCMPVCLCISEKVIDRLRAI